ncbi:hypothetical protein U1Q18_012932 [Sarracenia purpurea var. burkii]
MKSEIDLVVRLRVLLGLRTSFEASIAKRRSFGKFVDRDTIVVHGPDGFHCRSPEPLRLKSQPTM